VHNERESWEKLSGKFHVGDYKERTLNFWTVHSKRLITPLVNQPTKQVTFKTCPEGWGRSSSVRVLASNMGSILSTTKISQNKNLPWNPPGGP
jgi:hypothetical protein